MKKSIFNISQIIKEGVLIYNAFTTSLIELNNDLYKKIFMENDFSVEEIADLYDMGFLVDDSYDEINAMEKIRKAVIDNSSKKIANIIIAPTLECNAHCYYCFENGFRNGSMSIDTADCLVDFIEQNWNEDKLGITWFGGEPLLSSDIIDYISNKLKEKSIEFGCKITTNASLFDKRMIEKAVKSWNVEIIQVTIDAIGTEYNNIKKYDSEYVDAFSDVIKNIKEILLHDLSVKIRINFDPNNQQKALEVMNYLLESFNNSKHLKFYFAPIDADDEIVKNISLEFSEYNEHPYISLIKFGRKHNLYRGFPDMEDSVEYKSKFDANGILKKLKIYPSTTNCYAACPNVLSIGPEGEIYKCHRTLGRKEYVCGNIRTGIDKNDAYSFFCNTDLSYDECSTCSILPICQGGCKVNAEFYSGKKACAPSKAIIKDLILLYREDLNKKS